MNQLSSHSLIGNLRDKLSTIDPNLCESLDSLLGTTFGLLFTFLSNELSAQQRQIWLALAQYYPEPKSGSELALITGSSKSSKSIYKSIEVLRKKNLIIVHQPHPRTFSIQINPEHPLSELLIEYCSYYGKRD